MENIKEIRLRKPAAASIWYIASGGFARGIGALTTPIFTRLLTPTEYGLYPLYNSWISVFSVFITLELTGSLIFRGFQKYEEQKDAFICATLGLLSIIFIIFCALYFAFYSTLGEITGLNLTTTFFMFAQIFATAVISLYTSRAKFEYKYRTVVALNITSATFSPLLAIFFILAINLKSEARIYASAITALLISMPLIINIIRKSKKLYSKEIWKFLLKRGIPLIPHYFATSLILRASDISIGRTHGTESLGKYSIAMSIGMLLTIVTSGLLSALGPWLIRRIKDGNIERIRDFLFLLTKALAILSLLILSLAPEIFSLLATEDFRSALPSVYPLEIAAIASFISGAIMSGCAYYERGFFSSLPAIASALLSVILSFTILPKIDYRFASLFTLLSYLLMTLLTAIIFKKLSGEFPIRLKSSASLMILTLGYAALLFIFNSVLISRIFLALPLIPLLILCAKNILCYIKE